MTRLNRVLILLALAVFHAGPLCGDKDTHAACRLETQTLDKYGETRKHQLTVTWQSLSPRYEQRHGTPVFTLTLTNLKNARREIEVSAAAGGSAVQKAVLEPGATVMLPFNLPKGDISYYGGCEIELREGAESWRIGTICTDFYSSEEERVVNVLAGPELDAIATAADYAQEDEKALSTVSPKPSVRERFRFHFYTQAMGNAGWSDDVRVYTGHDIVLLTAAEWARLDAGVRRALVGYVAEGGALVLCGGKELPAEAEGFLPIPVVAPAGATSAFAVGDGHVVLAPPMYVTRRPTLARAELIKLGQASSRTLCSVLSTGSRPADLLRDMPALNLPVMPVSVFLLILAAFALGVVPGVLVFCIRRRQRIQSLVLLPLVSFVIGVVIVVAILAFYGITPRVSARAFVLLNAADRRAFVSGRLCVFSPRDVGSRLRFSPTAEIVVFGRSQELRYKTDTGHKLCLEGGAERKASGSDWVMPLRPALYALADMRDTNARLVVEERGADGVKVTNLLGGPLMDLQVVDSRGRLFAAQGIADGATCELAPAPAAVKPFTVDLQPKERRTCRRVFRAEMAGSPFLTDPLGGSDAKRTVQTTVIGGYGKEVSE